MRHRRSALFLCLLLPGACGESPRPRARVEGRPIEAPLRRMAPMEIPADNPLTWAKADLGHLLFFDPRLSINGRRSCRSCHQPQHGLSNGAAPATGAEGVAVEHDVPSLWNVGYLNQFSRDGRVSSLEDQVRDCWQGPALAARDPARVVARLQANDGYRDAFQEAFGEAPSERHVIHALAGFLRTVVSQTTPFDRWQAGDDSAVSAEAQRGYEVFKKAQCTNCHSGFLFTDQQYHNVGVGSQKAMPDLGRFRITGDEQHRGAYRTPSLRDVARTAPYFHDGSLPALELAVTIMAAGGQPNPYLDTENLQDADLSRREHNELVQFLRSLSEPQIIPEPVLPRD